MPTVKALTVDALTPVLPLFEAYRSLLGMPQTPRPVLVDFLVERLTKHQALLFQLTDDAGQAQGVALMAPSFSTALLSSKMVITDFYVPPGPEKPALEEAFLTQLVELAAEGGFAQVLLHATTQTVGLAQSQGFAPNTRWLPYAKTL